MHRHRQPPITRPAKRRRAAALARWLLGLTLVSGGVPAEDPPGGRLLRLDDPPFGLRLPEGWVEKRPRGSASAVLKISSNAADAANCYLEVETLDTALPARTLARERLALLRARHPDVELLAQGPRRVAGREGWQFDVAFTFESLGERHAVRNLSVVWRSGTRGLALTCGAWRERFDAQLPVFQGVIESLEQP